MNDNENYKFKFSWILVNKLAIGSSPIKKIDVDLLKGKGIKNILGLCSNSEVEWHSEIEKNFSSKRIFLPDSRSEIKLIYEDFKIAYENLEKFINGGGKTFVHCFASIERSPILVIFYLMKKYNMELEYSLDYVLKQHRDTNPKNYQLKLIKDFAKKIS